MYRCFALFVLAGGCLTYAAQTISVKQLTEFVRSCVEQKQPDKEVAEYVARVTLSEKLNESTVETLEGQGAGPKTVAALKNLAAASANLAAPKVEAQTASAKPAGPPGGPPPSYEEEQQVISDMTQYALSYTQRLPDFICTQVIRRYVDPRHRDSWINADTVVSKVSYVDGHENYEVKLVNNTLVENKSLESLNGAISTGEFGSMMREIFEPASGSEFHFERWGKLRGAVMYVFNYEVEQSHSKYSIDYARKQTVVTGYKGLVYVDKKDHSIARITAQAVNIPTAFPVRAASSVLDYDTAQVGTTSYILPIKAEMRISDAEVAMKNVIEFRSYKKFSADTSITYDDVDKPMDESKTREETPPVTK